MVLYHLNFGEGSDYTSTLNLFNFVLNLYDKKNKEININLKDEIIKETLIK